jgi:hypothetical protein
MTITTGRKGFRPVIILIQPVFEWPASFLHSPDFYEVKIGVFRVLQSPVPVPGPVMNRDWQAKADLS